MRKSRETKERLQKLYKECLANGGHTWVTVNKATNQQRCSHCDYTNGR